jgi:chromatin structure-remodeling complex subunit RSC9
MPPKSGSLKDTETHKIDRTDEYTEFIQKLDEFHKDRGTSFEAEPRLAVDGGHARVDLLKLYTISLENGGFDEISGRKTMWQNLARELALVNTGNMGQLGFQLKHIYLKYLGAYWIKDQYGKEPPPKEILELHSAAAKFGPILTRTMETFETHLKSGLDDTPVKETHLGENTPVSGNRASGRLREAPPQRVPFQPDTGPSRSTRHNSSQNTTPQGHNSHNSHTPQMQHHQHHIPQRHDSSASALQMIQHQQAALRGASSTYTPPNSDEASRLDQAFEPRPPISVTLRPVNTPGNNPIEFAKRQRQLRLAAAGAVEQQALARPSIPGSKC